MACFYENLCFVNSFLNFYYFSVCNKRKVWNKHIGWKNPRKLINVRDGPQFSESCLSGTLYNNCLKSFFPQNSNQILYNMQYNRQSKQVLLGGADSFE